MQKQLSGVLILGLKTSKSIPSSFQKVLKVIIEVYFYCYKLIQRFRVTSLFTGQYTTGYYGTITVIYWSVNNWLLWHSYRCYIVSQRISILLLGSDEVSSHNLQLGFFRFWREPQPIVLCQYSLHHIETRQIQHYVLKVEGPSYLFKYILFTF